MREHITVNEIPHWVVTFNHQICFTSKEDELNKDKAIKDARKQFMDLAASDESREQLEKTAYVTHAFYVPGKVEY